MKRHPPQKQCAFVIHSYGLNDPPARQAMESLVRRGFRVSVFHGPSVGVFPSLPPPGVEDVECPEPRVPESWGPLHRMAFWGTFRRELASFLNAVQPDLVVTFMLHVLALLPAQRKFRLLSSMLDIPVAMDLGKIDRPMCRAGWRRLREADRVWSSDPLKAALAREYGRLDETPMVCRNCPTRDYLEEPLWPRDGWLRDELRRQGAPLGATGGCILVRTGAVGEATGIEATFQAMRNLPEDLVFLLIGRPLKPYVEKIHALVRELGLHRRVVLWTNPSDSVWKRALLGADIGHMVHGPYTDPAGVRAFELNSSLSNNRLFQYMAAGLPIIANDDPRLDDMYGEVACFDVVRWSSLREDLEGVIARLAASPEEREARGRAGRAAHLATYNWETQFAPLADVIDRLVEGTSEPRTGVGGVRYL